MATEPLDLDEISEKWLNPCGSHDYGLDWAGCTCPDGDHRPVILSLIEEVRRLRATSERFTDPTVTEAVAREIAAAERDQSCPACWTGNRPCNRHIAEHLVEAMRAERLVVLTIQAADEIVTGLREVPNA